MCQVNKTHSGQFTLGTSQRKEKWAGKKKTREEGVGSGWGSLLSPSTSFPPYFFPSSLPPRRTPPAERLEQASLLLCDSSSALFQNIQAKGKGGMLFGGKDSSLKTLIESKGTTAKWINL